MSMNNWNGIGRLTTNLDNQGITYTRAGVAVIHFTLAVDRNYKDRQGNTPADFIRCELWGRGGQNPNNNNVTTLVSGTTKGSRLGVDGRIQTGRYMDQQSGQYIYTWGVRVNNYTFCDPKPQSQQQQAPQGTANPFGANAPVNNQPNNAPQKTANPFAPTNNGNQGGVTTGTKQPANPFQPPKKNNPAPVGANGNNKPKQPVTGGQVRNGSKKIDISDDDLPF